MLRPMNDFNDYLLINTTHDLENLCSRLQGVPWMAIDTEFMRESTFFPKLCLLQLATSQLVACIDVLSIKDISKLIDLIYNKNITKVMHAARQDMEIFYHLRGELPQPIFDSQIAAPLLGYPEQIGYAALVETLIGVHLSKAHTRTDWSYRPLSNDQLRYAADDVRYLAQLYPVLCRKLEDLNRLDWLADDFVALTNPSQYERTPEQAWLRIKGHQQLRGSRLAVLQALAAWRERTAQSEDRPRNWVLRDENLLDLAKIQPIDKSEMTRIRGINTQFIHNYGDIVVTIVKESREQAPIPKPPDIVVTRPSAGQEAVIDLLLTATRVLGDQHTINPAVITNRKELERMINGDLTVNVLSGWRRKLAGEYLLAVMQGEFCLRIENDLVRSIKIN